MSASFLLDTVGDYNNYKAVKSSGSFDKNSSKSVQENVPSSFINAFKPSKTKSFEFVDEVDHTEVQKVLKKAIVTPDFESVKYLPPLLSKRKLQQERKKERERSKGKAWFGLPATEMTEEVKRDLEIIKMRSVLDPKHFYKKNDQVLPKYFQIGKVVDSPLDFYKDRLTRKERKKTLVDELLADAEFQKYNKRKYAEIIEEKQKTHYNSWRKAKRLKKKK